MGYAAVFKIPFLKFWGAGDLVTYIVRKCEVDYRVGIT